jgi:IclR family transcriptional regulator, acetate operon repressor
MKVLAFLIDAGNPTVGVRELAAKVDLPPSSVHRTLNQLESLSLVQWEPDGRYALGVEAMRWGQLLSHLFPLRSIALPHLRRLVEESGETALLGIYNPQVGQMMYAASVESQQLLRYTITLQEWRPLYAGASGQAILAFLPDDAVSHLVDGAPLVPITDQTVTDPQALKDALVRIRREGVAVTHGEHISGAVGIAAPIFDRHLDIVGDICITLPEQRFHESSSAQLTSQVVECARAVSRDLGAPDVMNHWPPTKTRNERQTDVHAQN